MKFHVAWDSLEKENRNLKVLVIVLCLLAIALAVVVMNTSVQTPLIIERSCVTRMMSTVDSKPTEEEMKVFVEKAIAARFNFQGADMDLLSLKQRGFREKEQTELSKQKMKQTVLVNSVQISKDGILIDADRVISVSTIRTALRFPLKAQLELTDRSEGNPYGLVLTEVDPVGEEKKQ